MLVLGILRFGDFRGFGDSVISETNRFRRLTGFRGFEFRRLTFVDRCGTFFGVS